MNRRRCAFATTSTSGFTRSCAVTLVTAASSLTPGIASFSLTPLINPTSLSPVIGLFSLALYTKLPGDRCLTHIGREGGSAISGKTFTWASSDESVATVSSSGLVTAVASGMATITATTDAVSGEATITVLVTLWEFVTGDPVSSSPAMSADGTVYVGSWDYNLYAINPDGTRRWEFVTGDEVHSSPAIDTDGTVYVGS
ncbi:MAG: PQQ-binding-like beta-propeller repeat protein, partial [Gemmatimonadales bacterium]